MDRAGLITLEQARGAGLSFDEPEPRACPHCGAALEPLGAALAGRVAWVSAAPCPCEGATSEREAEARRRAALAAKEEAARREKALVRAGIPRRYWAAEADRPEFAEYIASFAGNGGAGLYIHGGVGAGKTHAASAMARLFAEAGYEVAFTTAKGMLERVKATFDEGGTEAAVARYAKCDVLVLDDLGKEDATEWSVGTVFSVLDTRYEDMRPTIVTSNYAPGALADRLARRGVHVGELALDRRDAIRDEVAVDVPVAGVEVDEVHRVHGLVVVVAPLRELPRHRPQGPAVHEYAVLVSRVGLRRQRYANEVAQVLRLAEAGALAPLAERVVVASLHVR